MPLRAPTCSRQLLPGLERDLVAARAQRPAERDRREGMTGVAEGPDQDFQAACARVSRSISARSRSICELRFSCVSCAIGVTSSVPTPASR